MPSRINVPSGRDSLGLEVKVKVRSLGQFCVIKTIDTDVVRLRVSQVKVKMKVKVTEPCIWHG